MVNSLWAAVLLGRPRPRGINVRALDLQPSTRSIRKETIIIIGFLGEIESMWVIPQGDHLVLKVEGFPIILKRCENGGGGTEQVISPRPLTATTEDLDLRA